VYKCSPSASELYSCFSKICAIHSPNVLTFRTHIGLKETSNQLYEVCASPLTIVQKSRQRCMEGVGCEQYLISYRLPRTQNQGSVCWTVCTSTLTRWMCLKEYALTRFTGPAANPPNLPKCQACSVVLLEVDCLEARKRQPRNHRSPACFL
jgi:hypothetical protein